MAKRRNAAQTAERKLETGQISLPKGVMQRLKLGQSFAEYDPTLLDQQAYVRTPAFDAALDRESEKVLFVGRRGTGKTALRTYCDSQVGHARVIVPEIFSPSSKVFELDLLENTKKGPFRSLVAVFKRTLLDELLISWKDAHPTYAQLPQLTASELAGNCRVDFDERTLQLIAEVARAVAAEDDSAIISINKGTKQLTAEMKSLENPRTSHTLLVDSIDDFWDGSDLALTYLTALMHACLELSAQIPWGRALLFLRENIFERVRARDPESSRVETAVSGLDWTQRHLEEMVERRFNRALTAKLPLDGSTWNAFFEDPARARADIFGYCHNRPRDVLIYISHAISAAQERGHDRIQLEDVAGARRRFSDNRLKDLGDEYAENFPQIALVLRRFYGLGRRYTPAGIEAFIRKLLVDETVKKLCATWIFRYSSMEQFVRLLYNIGFVGIKQPNRPVRFRALGPQDTSPPAVSDDTEIEIHPCYWDALDLQDVLVRDLSDDQELGRAGVLFDLPGGLNPDSYAERLDDLADRLVNIPLGTAGASAWEDAVGDIIKLCFFRVLDNAEPRVRSEDGSVIRDWIASNRAQAGFWAAMRARWDATQVVWECKNYEELKSSDFHQVNYYMVNSIGRFVIIAFRGEVQPGNYAHIRRIAAEHNGMVLPLGIRDLKTFVRQNRNGKIKEEHIAERYDYIVRKAT
jgi:hypothetical protein